MAVRQRLKRFMMNTRAYAVVEATILFPIVLLVFTGLALLSVYLPERAVLQEATQYAATALTVEQSDTWLKFDDKQVKYEWERDKKALPNVYVAFFSVLSGKVDKSGAKETVTKIEGDSIVAKSGDLEVDVRLQNYIIYKEVTVTATRTVVSPVDLSLVGFPKEIPITVSSTAIVQNGDEFVRTMDIASDFVEYLNTKYGLGLDKLSDAFNKVWKFLGVK